MNKVSTIAWSNPAQNTDGTPFDPATQQAGITFVLDGAPAVSVASGAGNSLDVSAVAAFQGLKSGNHTLQIDVVTVAGVHSALSGAATFLIDAVPNAPTGLTIK